MATVASAAVTATAAAAAAATSRARGTAILWRSVSTASTGVGDDPSADPSSSSSSTSSASGATDWNSVLAMLNERVTGLPKTVGFRVDRVEHGRLLASLDVAPRLMAANGYLHAGTVVTLADTACGYGCFASLPRDRANFTTVNLSCQMIGTAVAGELKVEAVMRHSGRSTQVWDAEVRAAAPSSSSEQQRGAVGGGDGEQGKTIALFRCTQLLLDPRKSTEQR